MQGKYPERFDVSHDAVDLVDELEKFIRMIADNPSIESEQLELSRRKLRDMFRARDARPGIVTDKST